MCLLRLIDSDHFFSNVKPTVVFRFFRGGIIVVMSPCSVGAEAVRVVDTQVPALWSQTDILISDRSTNRNNSRRFFRKTWNSQKILQNQIKKFQKKRWELTADFYDFCMQSSSINLVSLLRIWAAYMSLKRTPFWIRYNLRRSQLPVDHGERACIDITNGRKNKV